MKIAHRYKKKFNILTKFRIQNMNFYIHCLGIIINYSNILLN